VSEGKVFSKNRTVVNENKLTLAMSASEPKAWKAPPRAGHAAKKAMSKIMDTAVNLVHMRSTILVASFWFKKNKEKNAAGKDHDIPALPAHNSAMHVQIITKIRSFSAISLLRWAWNCCILNLAIARHENLAGKVGCGGGFFVVTKANATGYCRNTTIEAALKS
jgi:hypothetical protein